MSVGSEFCCFFFLENVSFGLTIPDKKRNLSQNYPFDRLHFLGTGAGHDRLHFLCIGAGHDRLHFLVIGAGHDRLHFLGIGAGHPKHT